MKKNLATKKGAKVFIGMSGGVDSSVSAVLLKEQGYDVTGVFIKVWHPSFLPCNWREERLDAMRVCAKLNIPFLTFDFEEEYKRDVVDYMISEYKSGRTPNPDVMCNKNVKFGAFLNKALKMGADYIATGHYAQNIHNKLHESTDSEKDQTYFLWTLTERELSRVLFPVGGLTKPEVRKLAARYKLSTAVKKDSQGLCFIGKVDIKEFLKKYIDAKPGSVLNEKGKVIGEHEGSWFYTIGQRHGFEITEKTTSDKPLYIIAKDVVKNIITVAPHAEDQGHVLEINSLDLKEVSWTTSTEPDTNLEYLGRIRYRQPLTKCVLKKTKEGYSVVFDEPQIAVSRGQSVVLYRDGRCVGGGIISY